MFINFGTHNHRTVILARLPVAFRAFLKLTWVRTSPRVKGIVAVRNKSDIARINTKIFLRQKVGMGQQQNHFYRGVLISDRHVKANITREFPTTEYVTLLNSEFCFAIFQTNLYFHFCSLNP